MHVHSSPSWAHAGVFKAGFVGNYTMLTTYVDVQHLTRHTSMMKP